MYKTLERMKNSGTESAFDALCKYIFRSYFSSYGWFIKSKSLKGPKTT
jgi:hypothetical protein